MEDPGGSAVALLEWDLVAVYVPESFTDDEADVLRRYFTNLDGPVFALVNLPEVVKGALFARYSRSHKSLRRLFLDEFVGELDRRIDGKPHVVTLRVYVRHLESARPFVARLQEIQFDVLQANLDGSETAALCGRRFTRRQQLVDRAALHRAARVKVQHEVGIGGVAALVQGREVHVVRQGVDEAGRLWVLEINANPCLSPDAGFAAALERAGIAYVDAIGRILADGCVPHNAVSETRQPAMAHGRS